MGKIMGTVVKFFEDDDWRISVEKGDSILRLTVSGKNGNWTCYAQVREEQEQFVFYSVCPVNAPENKRQDIAEFITRANYGLFIGNFEMDFEDGEVRYKTSIDVEGDRLVSALIRQLVYQNVATMDRYLPGVMSVIYGAVSPTQAITQVES